MTRAILMMLSSGLAYGLFLPIWILHFQKTGLSLLEIGLVGAIFEITKLLLEVPTGTLADRHGPLWSVRVGYFLFAFSWLMFLCVEGFYSCAGFMIVMAVAECFISGAFEAWLSQKIGPERFAKDYLKYSIFGLFANGVACIASGRLYEISPLLPFALVLALTTFKFGLIMSERYSYAQERVVARRPAGAILREGIRFCLRHPTTLVLIVAGFFAAFTFDGISRFWQPGLAARGISAVAMGDILSTSSFLSIVVLLFSKQLGGITRGPLMVIAGIDLLAVGFIFATFWGPTALAPLALSLLLSVENARQPIVTAALNSYFPQEIKATLFSIVSWVGALGEVFAGLVLGLSAKWLGLSSIYFFCALALVVSVAFCLLGQASSRSESCADSQAA